MTRQMTRRELLRMGGLGSMVAFLAACQPKVVEKAVEKEVTKIVKEVVKETVIVEGTPKVVEREVTRIIEVTRAPESAAKPAPQERVVVEVLGGTGEGGDFVDEWHEKNPNIDYKEVAQVEGSSRLMQLMAVVAAGTPPDVARVESDVYRTFAHLGLLLPIDEYIKTDPEFSKPDYWIQPQETERCEYRGHWYGIGSSWVAPHLYYLRETLEDAGVEPPSNDPDEAWTWDQFLENARKLTVDREGRQPGDAEFDIEDVDRWGTQWPTWWIPLHAAVQSNGSNWIDPETEKLVIDSPNAMEALQRIADLIFVHQVMPRPDVMEGLGMGGAQLLETKKVALLIDGSWALSWFWEMEGTLGTAVLPKMQRPATDMQAHLMTVVKDSKHPYEAWKLVRFLSSPWFQERVLMQGIWLPSQTALMTEEALARWCVPPVHPEGYRDIVLKYTPKYGHYLTMPVGYPKAVDIAVQPVFDQIFAGRAKAEDVLPEAVAEGNRIMAEEQARPQA